MKHSKLHVIFLTIAIFAFYLACMPQSVTLEDDGLFLLSSYFNGVSHPPGYPLHSLLGRFVTHLPIGNPALNGHALSALFSALSSMLIFFITLKLASNNTTKKLIAYTAAIAFTLSSGVWSQSIITEVYTLNAFLFLCVFLSALNLDYSLSNNTSDRNRNQCKRYLFSLALFSGLALANHWPLFILGSIGILFIVLRHYQYLTKHWPIILVGLSIGLLPYLWLYINANSDTIIKFLGPIENLREFYDYVARKNYNLSIDFSETATIYDKLSFVHFTLRQLLNQWGILNSLFIPVGIFLFLISNKRNKNRHWYRGLVISYFSTSLLLVIILGYNFTVRNQTNIQPFLVLSHSLGAIIFAFGIHYVINTFQSFTKINLKLVLIPIILVQMLAANGIKNYRANYNWADLYATHVLDSLEQNSILFVSGDEAIGPIGYWHLIKGYRPDITLISEGGEVINNTRLFDPRKTEPNERPDIILKFAQTSKKPVYFINNFIKINSDGYWLVYKYNPSIKSGKVRLQPLNTQNKKYLDFIFSDINYFDQWTIQHQKHLRKRALGHLILEVEQAKSEVERKKFVHFISKLTRDLNELTHTLSILSILNKTHYLGSKEEIIKKGWILFEAEKDNKIKSHFLNLLAHISLNEGESKKGLKLLKKSIELWPTRDNKAYILQEKIKKLALPSDNNVTKNYNNSKLFFKEI